MKYPNLKKFPEIRAGDRILVLAPHIDDEAISSAGIIQQAETKGAKILVVYATNGDGTSYPLVRKLLRSGWFVSFGKKRMVEAKNAAACLGLNKENLIFLGYPDQVLKIMFNNPAVFTSKSTRLNYNPYLETYRQKQLYIGKNLIKDLAEIMLDFKPTMAIISHPRDIHPDHRYLFWFLQKAMVQANLWPDQYGYLVHFKSYSAKKALLQPPPKLAGSNRWYSFDLSLMQKQKKLAAIRANASQLKRFPVRNFLGAFARQNEIFEKINANELPWPLPANKRNNRTLMKLWE